MVTGNDLKKALKFNELTMEEASDKLGISRGTLYKIMAKEELDEDFIQNVQEKLQIDLNATALPFLEQRRERKNHEEIYLVPFIDIPAQAGYVKAYDHVDYIQTLRKYPILPDVDPIGAIWRYFQIQGDSMEPEFRSGDIILCSQVPRDDWNEFRDFHVYVIVTDNNLWIKNVYKESEKEWFLLSENDEEYDPILINVEDVRQLWVMRRHIKNRAKKKKMFDIEEIRKKIKG